MCELLGMSSCRPATVSLSLMRLAEHGGFSGPHRDGWGIGYYEDGDVRLIKEAAADSAWVRFLESHEVRSPIVIGHIRKATMGARAYRNTQPFARELGGRMHLFAHGDRRKHADTGQVAAPGIVLQQRWCRHGERGFATAGLTVSGADQWLALVASVPLSDEPWQPLAEGELVAIVQGRLVMRGCITDDAPA